MHSHTFFQPWLKAHHTIFHTTKQRTHKIFSLCLQNLHKKLVNQQHLFPFTGTTGGLGNGVPPSKIQRPRVFFLSIIAFQPRPQQLLELVKWFKTPARKPVEDGTYPTIIQGFIHPRWCSPFHYFLELWHICSDYIGPCWLIRRKSNYRPNRTKIALNLRWARGSMSAKCFHLWRITKTFCCLAMFKSCFF